MTKGSASQETGMAPGLRKFGKFRSSTAMLLGEGGHLESSSQSKGLRYKALF